MLWLSPTFAFWRCDSLTHFLLDFVTLSHFCSVTFLSLFLFNYSILWLMSHRFFDSLAFWLIGPFASLHVWLIYSLYLLLFMYVFMCFLKSLFYDSLTIGSVNVCILGFVICPWAFGISAWELIERCFKIWGIVGLRSFTHAMSCRRWHIVWWWPIIWWWPINR